MYYYLLCKANYYLYKKSDKYKIGVAFKKLNAIIISILFLDIFLTYFNSINLYYLPE